jgi:hypothetical protein
MPLGKVEHFLIRESVKQISCDQWDKFRILFNVIFVLTIQSWDDKGKARMTGTKEKGRSVNDSPKGNMVNTSR